MKKLLKLVKNLKTVTIVKCVYNIVNVKYPESII